MKQRKYELELLTDASLLACKPAPTLIDNHAKLSFTELFLSQMFKPMED